MGRFTYPVVCCHQFYEQMAIELFIPDRVIPLWNFLIAGLFCLFISFFTVLPQSYQAAKSTHILDYH